MNPVKTVQDLERKKQELTDQFNEIVKKNTCLKWWVFFFGFMYGYIFTICKLSTWHHIKEVQ